MSHIPARMTPVRVPYRSPASRALGEQLASACRDRQDAPALEVGAWVVDWTGPEDDACDEPGNWTVMIGYQAPVFPRCPDPTQPAWMYLHLALQAPDEVGEAARRVLDGGLSVDRLTAARPANLEFGDAGMSMGAWRRAGYPLVSRYPSWDHELLPYVAALDALDDEARQTAIRLGSQGWVGTPEQLVFAALAITTEEHH